MADSIALNELSKRRILNFWLGEKSPVKFLVEYSPNCYEGEDNVTWAEVTSIRVMWGFIPIDTFSMVVGVQCNGAREPKSVFSVDYKYKGINYYWSGLYPTSDDEAMCKEVESRLFSLVEGTIKKKLAVCQI